MGTAQKLKEYENKLFKNLLKESVFKKSIGDDNILEYKLGSMNKKAFIDGLDGEMNMDAHSIALELKDKLPRHPTEVDVFDALCDMGYCGSDLESLFNDVLSELINMGVDITLLEGKKKKKWIQQVVKSIKKRGTEGKCTPITKPTCTGRAKILAQTFKKLAQKRRKKSTTNEEELITKKPLTLSESGTPGIDIYNKIHKESGESNKAEIKKLIDNVKSFTKISDKNENQKISGIGKGEPKYSNFDKKQTERDEEYFNILRGMGQQDIQFDTEPSEDFKKRAEEAIVGSARMGNDPNWANAQRDFDGTKGELGKKIINAAKKKKEAFDKTGKEDHYSIRFKYPTKKHKETHIAVNENKLPTLKTKRIIYFHKDIDDLIPESHKIEGAQFKLIDGNDTIYGLKWEGGTVVVEYEKNQKMLESERNLFKRLAEYSIGQYNVKPRGYITEETKK